ncbi:hypothetical protein [Porphyromonas somerae]|uniref:hypothetical protein n=1 Tax=Porphyromonas somerae TaxID=322095 RepID=UPI002A74AA32|nr:hypothetical protein [Porphyromonas somerae]MDY3120084.1 hypothetical protein [Porphyromonas somerae]
MRQSSRILACILLFTGLSATISAQDVNESNTLSSKWSAELGYQSGIVFEHPIGKHFSMRYNLGILIFQRLQPYQTYQKKVNIDVEYAGMMPFLSIGTRWYPKPLNNNSGFHLGLNFQYNHHKWKFAIDPNKDVYDLENEGVFVFDIGYSYNLVKNLNIKAALLPSIGAAFANQGKTVYGTIDMRYDLGLSYSF